MSDCPSCGKQLMPERRELARGTFVNVDVCSNCNDEWLAKEQNGNIERLFERKAFKAGGSVAIRIPAEIATRFGIEEGRKVSFSIHENGVLIVPE